MRILPLATRITIFRGAWWSPIQKDRGSSPVLSRHHCVAMTVTYHESISTITPARMPPTTTIAAVIMIERSFGWSSRTSVSARSRHCMKVVPSPSLTLVSLTHRAARRRGGSARRPWLCPTMPPASRTAHAGVTQKTRSTVRDPGRRIPEARLHWFKTVVRQHQDATSWCCLH